MSTPTPWKRGDDPELRALMEHAAAEAPSAAQLAALSASVKAGVAATSALGGTVVMKIVVASLLGGALATALVWTWARAPEPVPESAPVPVPVPESVPEPAPEPVSEPVPARAPVHPPRLPSRPHIPRSPEPQIQPVLVQKSDEPALLMEARGALQANALATARSALAAHERDYPDGAFREEREALAVELLARSNDPALPERLARFVARYPRSPYRERLAKYLSRP